MLILIHAPEDDALASRLRTDLQTAGYTLNPTLQSGGILIVVLSAAGVANPAVNAAITQALDTGLHIIPIVIHPAALPELIDHLDALDFSQQYPFATLQTRIDQLSRAETRPPLKVRTPAVRASNRRIGIWLVALALVWFILGLVLVGFYGIQAPREEYNTISTLEFATVQVYLSRSQPRTTEDALSFPVTLQAAPTAQRPLLIATATALMETPPKFR